MLSVKVGKYDYEGVVYMTFATYIRELTRDGGKKYVNVYCKHGAESFRIKYLREVKTIDGGKDAA